MELLTTQALWENYDPAAEPIEANVFKIVEKDGIVTKYMFFTGRTLPNGSKTRIYAIVSSKNTKPVKQAALMVGDYKKPINTGDLEQLAKSGFVAMAIDLAGENDEGMFTAYPTQLKYCNAKYARDMFFVETSARETKMYEYALGCRRAITYLIQEEKIKGVSLVSIGSGVYVGLMVMGVDNRLSNGAALFGALSCAYPSADEQEKVDTADAESLNRHLEYDVKRQCWTMGIAPQTYAQQIQIPVYVINSANSASVDIEGVEKMKSRLNGNCRYLVLPAAVDYISDKYFEGLVKWLKGAAVTTNKTLVSYTDENGDYCIKIQTSSSINKTTLWYCVNPRGKARYWRSVKLTREGDCYVAKPELYEKENEVIAFALFDREVATSTQLFYDKVTVARPKIVNKNIFSGNGGQHLINLPLDERRLNLDLEQKLTEGYLGIVGAKGNALCTFAVSDAGIRKNSSITLGFDICCDVKQTLTVTAVAKFGDKNEKFCQIVNLDGNGKWQRVTIERENFRRKEDGKQISEGDIIDAIAISAEDIIINNVFLV